LIRPDHPRHGECRSTWPDQIETQWWFHCSPNTQLWGCLRHRFFYRDIIRVSSVLIVINEGLALVMLPVWANGIYVGISPL